MTNDFYMKLVEENESLKSLQPLFKMFNCAGKTENIQRFIDDNKGQVSDNVDVLVELQKLAALKN